ncbi:uncharacterized protein LOC142985501 [Anticarsia gemmatalis]|uniref:uncharacterized protein LOC142985501 n=1 Tax=Anticarsia gemmatalis TaxID=129554 RepID=UPI003F77813E
MALKALVVLALITYTAAAPWRCYTTCDGSTVCFGEQGAPCISPPQICLSRPCPPCNGPATVYTPCQCPSPCPPPPCPPPPCPPPPCPCPCPPPPCY